MSTTSRRLTCPPSRVFEILADGWQYANWVVGAARVRDVDADWPAQGARIAHSVGVWPMLLDDHTEVLSCEPDRQLVLKARAWPAGQARVQIDVAADGPGSVVTIVEDVVAGPGKFIPAPVRQPLLHRRNTESLQRLAFLAEGRADR